ncbi:hypothetical protein L0Y65_05665 [Candidatus Micrarchaeota archaeon]|nr:hypothetical protein [Candidatus Micrarchaeota archaeon]
MASNVIDLTKRRKEKKMPPAPRPFAKVAAHLASLEKKEGNSEDRAVVSEEVAKMADALEGELENGGSALKARVEGHLRTMASGAPDPISPMGVEFRSPASGKTITLGDGETAKPGAEKKIESIILECVTVAKSDLALLKKAQSALEAGREPDADTLKNLKSILGGNSYWRFIRTL